MSYGCDVLKRGRAIDVVTVRARQQARIVMSVDVSFHDPEGGSELATTIPDAGDPDTLPPSSYRPPQTLPSVRAPFEVKYADAQHGNSDPANSGPLVNAWIRTRNPVGSSAPVVHAALLAYAVDFLITRPIRRSLGNPSMAGASLDHSMWFHRSFAIDDWVLVSGIAWSFADGRGLASASIFRRDGAHIASATQEALLRPIVD